MAAFSGVPACVPVSAGTRQGLAELQPELAKRQPVLPAPCRPVRGALRVLTLTA